MTLVLEADGLGKKYGRHQALADCNLKIPVGRVIGLVGPNGAGKSTLLGLTCGMIKPTDGTIKVLGSEPTDSSEQLARVGFVAQDTPVYANLTVAEHLRLGAKLNPRWDQSLAERRIQQLNLGLDQKAGGFQVGSARSSRSPLPPPSGRSCSSSTSRSPHWIRWLAGGSCRT